METSESHRVNVQSIRDKFERCNNNNNIILNSNNTNNNISEVLGHNRISIKRSPAFRTGTKTGAVASVAETVKRKPSDVEPVHRKPSVAEPVKRKPSVAETVNRKPSVAEPVTYVCKSSSIGLEEALKAPLPSGPAPKKPPRTFLYSSTCLSLPDQGRNSLGPEAGSVSSGSSPQRPARRKSSRLLTKDVQEVQEKPLVNQLPTRNGAKPGAMMRSKTEPSLNGRGGRGQVQRQVAELEQPKTESRWLNPVQWNSISPLPARKSTLSKSMWSLAADPAPESLHQRTRNVAIRRAKNPLSQSKVECNNQVRSSWHSLNKNVEAAERCSFAQGPGVEGGRVAGHRTPVVLEKHFYDSPSKEGDLHYMCSPIIEVADINSWNVDKTDESDADSEISDIRSNQIVEDRKIYIRRVSSNVCDLRRGRPRDVLGTSSGADPASGLFETLLVGALVFDRETHQYTPYIKSHYPHKSSVPNGVEQLCFPDASHWPPALASAAEPFTIVLTDAKGDRTYGYCRRIVPEGALTCIPITYCILSRHRAAVFYAKLLSLLVSRHGASESQRVALFDYLHSQKFPAPGRSLDFPIDGKVVKVQRLLDYRLEDIDLRALFHHLSETIVLHILATLLLERKLIFISKNLSVLSVCVDAVQSMLYPFVWQHTLVPILPQTMTEISSAPTPFILGMLANNVDHWHSIKPDHGMLVDLDSGKVLHSVGDEASILPRRSQRILRSAWEITFNITQQAESARNALLSQSFLRLFVDLCGHYQQHIHCDDSGHKYFERAAFARDHSSQGARMFLEWFTETAMFNIFVESRLSSDAVQTLFEHKIMEHSIHLVRNNQLIVPNSKMLGRKIKTIGDKLREMNMFSLP